MLCGHFKNTKSDSHIHSQCSQHPSCTHFIFISHSDPLLSRCFNARFRLAWGHFSVRLIFSARLSLLMWTYQSFDLFRNSMDERNYPPRYKHNHSEWDDTKYVVENIAKSCRFIYAVTTHGQCHGVPFARINYYAVIPATLCLFTISPSFAFSQSTTLA